MLRQDVQDGILILYILSILSKIQRLPSESVNGTDLGAAFVTALVVWLAALMTPGPDFAATVHASVGGSRRNGLGVAAGVTAGMIGWATASLFGLHVILLAFAELATAVRLAGAAYLVWIGARLLWAAWQGGAGHTSSAARPRSIA